jgi:hypothetical protein
MTIRTTDSTLLALDVMALSAYASRKMSQTIEPIDQAADLRRTVNGELVNFGDDVFQKYRTTVSGADHRPPSIDGIWPGVEITLHCVAELSFLTSGGTAQRYAVAESMREEGDLTFYRPVLDVMVTAFTTSFDEWSAEWSWSITFEEI